MADLYILTSIPNQGKTTTALLLEKKLKSEGRRVTCLQATKGPNDIHRYLFEDCCHYSVPVEATKDRSTFEQWVPHGYDSYILEVPFPYTPLRAGYVDLFQNINEVIPFENRGNWKEYVSGYLNQLGSRSKRERGPPLNLMALWDHVHNRNVRPVITKTPSVLEGACVDTDYVLHHAEHLAVESIEPRMKLPKGSSRAIAVGSFPAEYWDIFPSLKWFRYDYPAFMNSVREKQYDIAIIGACGSDNMKLRTPPDHGTIICYQPVAFLSMEKNRIRKSLSVDYPTILSIIKKDPPEKPLCPDGEPFSVFNNRFRVYQKYKSADPVWKAGNIVFCNGWVLPQHLIRDGYLEVS